MRNINSMSVDFETLRFQSLETCDGLAAISRVRISSGQGWVPR